MNWNSFLRSAGICLSSAASIFTSHALHGKTVEVKNGAKESKKARSNHVRDGEQEMPWSSFLSGLQDPPHKETRQYPWRNAIVTTTFWVGEHPTANNPVPNHKSSWDGRWAENYGGTDTPDRAERTSEFIPADFTPRQNPFYVALPYNDKTAAGHKPEAAKVIPWFQETYEAPGKSVCKGRWIAIRKGDRVCYAQWEDAGPFRTDHWEYVFGNERPKANLNRGAGLDVSPAVRDFLGMGDTDVTDWKFVEFEDVPTGPWARYGNNNTFVINQRAAEATRLAAVGKRREPLE